MRSTDYISKGTAVARLYKARESLLMDKDCRKGLCFYLRGVDILDYLEEIGIGNLDSFSIEVLWAYEDFINRGSIVALRNAKVVKRRLTLYSRRVRGAFCKNGPGWLICLGSFCVGMWDSGYPLIRGAKISWYSKGSTVPLNLTFENKK